MDEISYQERDGLATLATEDDGEWIQSDSVMMLDDWA